MIKDKPSRLDEATGWFAAIRKGAMLAEERVAFDVWRADPRNQAALDALHELWGELAVLKYLEPKRLRPRRAPALVAAAAAVAVLIGGAGATWLLTSSSTMIETAVGEQRTQTLPDGSVVAVNVVSRISYAFSDHARVVNIHDGEAAFAVKAEPGKSFVVRAGDYEVRASGSAFNVRQREGAIEIAVSQGRVDVCRSIANAPNAILVSLTAGEVIRLPAVWLDTAAPLPTSAIAPSDVAEWRIRVVSYERASLREVVADFNRYFQQRLLIEDPSLLEKRVTIRLQIEDRERAVATLASLLDLRIRETERGALLVK